MNRKFAALIVAAGYSSRMERFKPLLPLGEHTVIEQTIATFTAAGVENIIVVTGHNAEALNPVLEKVPVTVVKNERYDEGMFTSIKTGVMALPQSVDGFFMMPADMPFVMPDTIKQLMTTYSEQPSDVLYPTFNHKRGHPPLIARTVFKSILDSDGEGGLKRLLNHPEIHANHLEVTDEGILLDLDTYEDYLTHVKRLL